MFQLRWEDVASRKFLQAAAAAEPRVRDAWLTAVAEAEEKLADDPIEAGESRDADLRVLITELLTISFRVHHRLNQVVVVDIRVRLPKS